MTRSEAIEKLEEDKHRIEVNGVKYNATLSPRYLPKLDSNLANIRRNANDTTQITFFDLSDNVWVTLPLITVGLSNE